MQFTILWNVELVYCSGSPINFKGKTYCEFYAHIEASHEEEEVDEQDNTLD